tara:strand:- start:1533 stop:2039 length:507 start_codon:yes stop_codon:yes gene_type:complete
MKFFSNKLSWFIFYLNNKKLTLSEVKLLKENLNYSLINKMNLYTGFLFLNLYLLPPFSFVIKEKNYDDFENTVGLLLFRRGIICTDEYNLDLIAIKDNYKRKGIGSKMLKKMISEIKLKSPKANKISIYLKTLKSNNLEVNSFYRKNQFELTHFNKKYNFYKLSFKKF